MLNTGYCHVLTWSNITLHSAFCANHMLNVVLQENVEENSITNFLGSEIQAYDASITFLINSGLLGLFRQET
jgi:hypothetical protein